MTDTDPAKAPEPDPTREANLADQGHWQVVVFDLDDTLAPSKGALPDAVAAGLRALLEVKQVAVLSGGALPQFEFQLLGNLQPQPVHLPSLHLLPTCGTQYYRPVADGAGSAGDQEQVRLDCVYALDLEPEQRQEATRRLKQRAQQLGLWEENPWGEIIEDRGAQITFSALGQDAPLEAKRQWDPTGEKKGRLAALVAEDLPDLEVRSGGSTSIDITAKGVDKAFGMRQLEGHTKVGKDHTLFIGDRLDPAGNDYPVREAGWPTINVDSWEETADLIQRLVEAHVAPSTNS